LLPASAILAPFPQRNWQLNQAGITGPGGQKCLGAGYW